MASLCSESVFPMNKEGKELQSEFPRLYSIVLYVSVWALMLSPGVADASMTPTAYNG
jgi:hypothetical protein